MVQQLAEFSESNAACCGYEGENEFEVTDRYTEMFEVIDRSRFWGRMVSENHVFRN